MVDQGTQNTFDALRFFLVCAVYRLSVGAESQNAYLNSLLGHLVENGDTSGYGNDELALELHDAYLPLKSRSGLLCLTKDEVKLLDALDAYLERLSGENHYAFWRREALIADYRWMEVRKLAKAALKEMEKLDELPSSAVMLAASAYSFTGERKKSD